MGLQKRYTLPTFSLLAYFLASPRGQDQFNQYIAPNLLSREIREFSYKYKEAPLSDWPYPIIVCFSYLISVYVLRQFMKNKAPLDLKLFRIFHNAFLCFGSFVMVLGMLTQLFKAYQEGGAEALVCDSNRVQLKGYLYNWYYVFFLSKIYEFIDTYILIFRKKEIKFLHLFHHFITAFLCWLGLYDEIAIQWTVIVMNGTVHVFMYYYYLATSFNTDLWWKKYLTSMQITQFVVDIVMGAPYYYSILALGKNCSGTVWSLGFTHVILIAFIILFVNFFNHTYTKDGTSPSRSPKQRVE